MELVSGVVATPERTASSPSSPKAPSTQSSASKSPTSAKRSRSRDVELGPVLRTQRRKNSSAQKAFLPIPSQKSKSLRIGGHESPDDDMRRVHRRRTRLSGSPKDSPLAVIKHKRTISYEEYERLSLQLRGLVESSPQASLALTQNALARGFEDRPIGSISNGSGKKLAYVPGSMTSRDNGRGSDLEKKNSDSNGDLQLAVPYGKRARSNENRPIYFSGIALRGQMLTREERVERKPRPSRLLTGAKRDAAARSAYSSAVAEKILSTLNKVQNPLEREAKKPTPQTSLSWAKYHLALADDSENARMQDDEEPEDDVVPPTTTLPRVNFPSSPARLTTVPSKSLSVMRTPTVKSKASSALFSPQAVSMTPVVKQGGLRKFGTFAFTIPVREGDAHLKRKAFEMDVDDIQFVFSPSPSQREPPKRSSTKKTTKVNGAVEAPFSFVPASPKTRTDFLSTKSTTKVEASAPASAKPADVPIATTSSSSENPLARFTKLAPGSWKCPTCSVTNEATHAKCPCCETAKPAGAAVKATSTSATLSKSSAPAVASGVNPLARFTQLSPGSWKCPTCSVTNGAEHSKCPCCETAKPGASISAKPAEKPASSSSSGFTFGVPAAAAKPVETQKSGSGFTFGVTPAAEKTGNDASNLSFSFSAPPVSAADAGKTSFSFGSTDASTGSASKPSYAFTPPSKPSSEEKSSGFSFGVPASRVPEPAAKKPEQVTGFTFGNSSASDATKKPEQATGFSFGTSSTTSVKSSESIKASETKVATAAPSFTFGNVSSKPLVTSSEPAKTGSLGFPFGATATEKPKDSASTFGASTTVSSDASEPAQKKASFSFGKPDATPAASAFSFGGSSQPAPSSKAGASSAAKAPVPSFGSATSAGGSTETKLAFSFGSTTPQAPAPAKDEEKADAKPAFVFGSSPSSALAEKPSSGFGQDANPAFSFGQSSSETAPKAPSAAPAFGASGTPAFGSTAPVTTPAFGASPAAPASSSSFGNAAASTGASFTFGASSSSTAAPATTTPAVTSQPAFTFGASSGAQSTTPAAPAASSGFGASTSFGQTPTSTSTPSGFGSSAQPTASSAGPAFTFGSSTQAATPSQSTFSFGASAPTTSGFGSTAPASSGFGAAASGFGASAPASSAFGSATPAPSGFGTSAPAVSGFGSSAPSAGFGAPASSGFGVPATTPSAFGSAAPASSGFGASASSSTGFGAPATPSTTTFGSGAGAFGSAPATTFGASNPAASSAFGAPSSQPSSSFGSTSGFGSSGFGAPAAATTTFGAPAASAAQGFGSSASGFGAPTLSSGFGAPAASSGFGAPSSGFGGPAAAPVFGAPAPSSGFGNPSPTFGAPAAPAFGAPAPVSFAPPAGGFGAPGGFGGQQDGGFSVGAAPPQAPKGRRILKARSKRTS